MFSSWEYGSRAGYMGFEYRTNGEQHYENRVADYSYIPHNDIDLLGRVSLGTSTYNGASEVHHYTDQGWLPTTHLNSNSDGYAEDSYIKNDSEYQEEDYVESRPVKQKRKTNRKSKLNEHAGEPLFVYDNGIYRMIPLGANQKGLAVAPAVIDLSPPVPLNTMTDEELMLMFNISKADLHNRHGKYARGDIKADQVEEPLMSIEELREILMTRYAERAGHRKQNIDLSDDYLERILKYDCGYTVDGLFFNSGSCCFQALIGKNKFATFPVSCDEDVEEIRKFNVDAQKNNKPTLKVRYTVLSAVRLATIARNNAVRSGKIIPKILMKARFQSGIPGVLWNDFFQAWQAHWVWRGTLRIVSFPTNKTLSGPIFQQSFRKAVAMRKLFEAVFNIDKKRAKDVRRLQVDVDNLHAALGCRTDTTFLTTCSIDILTKQDFGHHQELYTEVVKSFEHGAPTKN